MLSLSGKQILNHKVRFGLRFPRSAGTTFDQKPIQSLCMLSPSLWVHVWVRSAVSRRPCFLACLHFLYLLWFFCLLFNRVPEPKREEFDENIPFKTMNSEVSHTLCNVWLWVSVFVPCAARGSYSDEDWAGLYKYSRMSSEVLLFLGSFRRTVVFGFPVGPFQSHVLGHPNVLGMGMGSVSWKGP